MHSFVLYVISPHWWRFITLQPIPVEACSKTSTAKEGFSVEGCIRAVRQEISLRERVTDFRRAEVEDGRRIWVHRSKGYWPVLQGPNLRNSSNVAVSVSFSCNFPHWLLNTCSQKTSAVQPLSTDIGPCVVLTKEGHWFSIYAKMLPHVVEDDVPSDEFTCMTAKQKKLWASSLSCRLIYLYFVSGLVIGRPSFISVTITQSSETPRVTIPTTSCDTPSVKTATFASKTPELRRRSP